MNDLHGRAITYLRLSVTDLCDLRCIYCMPESGAQTRACGEICSLEELCGMTAAAVRRGIADLCRMLRRIPGLEELCLTTNGILLPALAAPLRGAGVDRLNISLDTLRAGRYRAITRGGALCDVLRGLEAAEAAGFRNTRINCVLMGGINDDEIEDFVRLTEKRPICVRFIELMPMGVCAGWDKRSFLPARAVLERVPELSPVGESGTARLYRLPGARGTVGLIEPMSNAFCPQCSRIRITADGRLKPCLHSAAEISLRGLSGDALVDALRAGIAAKPEQHELAHDGITQTARAMHEIGG